MIDGYFFEFIVVQRAFGLLRFHLVFGITGIID